MYSARKFWAPPAKVWSVIISTRFPPRGSFKVIMGVICILYGSSAVTVSNLCPLSRENTAVRTPKSFHCGVGRFMRRFQGASPSLPISIDGSKPNRFFASAVCQPGMSLFASNLMFDSGSLKFGGGLSADEYAG
ncbi:unknown [Coraliomargarita sp. CAG:312]|nr:unknown [Coraliomargarita sp. CAG:312]